MMCQRMGLPPISTMGVGLRWYEMNNISTTAAKVIDDGEYQMVNLPEEFQFDGDEVWVQKIGDLVILMPKVNAEESVYLAQKNSS